MAAETICSRCGLNIEAARSMLREPENIESWTLATRLLMSHIHTCGLSTKALREVCKALNVPMCELKHIEPSPLQYLRN